MTQPTEKLIAQALTDAGIAFTREDRNAGRPARADDVTMDFHLVDFDIYVEVKQFHTPRIARQMAQAPNVIAVQGQQAVEFFASLIAAKGD